MILAKARDHSDWFKDWRKIQQKSGKENIKISNTKKESKDKIRLNCTLDHKANQQSKQIEAQKLNRQKHHDVKISQPSKEEPSWHSISWKKVVYLYYPDQESCKREKMGEPEESVRI